MRIRKRQVLFSSSLSPEPPSDPNLINRSPVVVQLRDATTTAPKLSSTPAVVLPQRDSTVAAASSLDPFQPSDQPFPPIGKSSNGCDDPTSGIRESGAHRQHNKQHPLEEDGRRQESGDSREKGNHTRKGSIFGSETLPPSSPSSTQDGRWCEGEKVIPLKKRRGSFENGMENNTSHGNSKKVKARMKTKMNKKCSTQNDNMEREDEDLVEEFRDVKPDVSVGKKRARGGALMEGSRCSRVNGRGWRCCQQTLVGYSLCEHHLGKGRLRSMTSVRSRSIASTSPKKVHELSSDPSLSGASSSSPEEQTKCVDDPLGNNDEKKPMIITKKRMKLGVVKARSISSLLGQTNTKIAVAHENNK